MSVKQGGVAPAMRNSIEAKGTEEPDTEMKDGSDVEASEDAEGESDAEGPQGILGLIQDTTSYLCKIEEEYYHRVHRVTAISAGYSADSD